MAYYLKVIYENLKYILQTVKKLLKKIHNSPIIDEIKCQQNILPKRWPKF